MSRIAGISRTFLKGRVEVPATIPGEQREKLVSVQFFIA
jgi:hypothetical protein